MTQICKSCGRDASESLCFKCFGLSILEQVQIPKNVQAHDHELAALEDKVMCEEAKIQQCQAKLANNQFRVDNLLTERLKQRHYKKQAQLVNRIAKLRILKGV